MSRPKQFKHAALTVLVLLLLSVICCNKVGLGYVSIPQHHLRMPPKTTPSPTGEHFYLKAFSSDGYENKELLDCSLIYKLLVWSSPVPETG